MPIRVGVIGLSAKPDAWASVAHVGPLKSNPDYELVALSASTPESAAAAAKAHGLPANKGYSSAEALAQDPDVDLVVVSVKVRQGQFRIEDSADSHARSFNTMLAPRGLP